MNFHSMIDELAKEPAVLFNHVVGRMDPSVGEYVRQFYHGYMDVVKDSNSTAVVAAAGGQVEKKTKTTTTQKLTCKDPAMNMVEIEGEMNNGIKRAMENNNNVKLSLGLDVGEITKMPENDMVRFIDGYHKESSNISTKINNTIIRDRGLLYTALFHRFLEKFGVKNGNIPRGAMAAFGNYLKEQNIGIQLQQAKCYMMYYSFATIFPAILLSNISLRSFIMNIKKIMVLLNNNRELCDGMTRTFESCRYEIVIQPPVQVMGNFSNQVEYFGSFYAVMNDSEATLDGKKMIEDEKEDEI